MNIKPWIFIINYELMKTTKILLISIALSILIGNPLAAQDEEDKGKRPVRAPFESALLIDTQSVIVPTAKTLELDMTHRFGVVENGISDFFGMYAPGANIRLGLTYSLVENLSLGVGFSKLNKYVDFNAKYAILKQTRDWSTPINLTAYGNIAIDTRGSENFEESVHRLSSYVELIVATRIHSKITIQVSPSFSHFNAVDSLLKNDMIGIGVSGRYKFSSQSSVIFGFDQQITSHDGLVDAKPNISLGLEVSTSSHAFQVFVSTFQGILPQHNMTFSENEFSADGILIGFNITRLWNF